MAAARRSVWPRVVAGLALLAFGLGCLNYTSAAGAEHHREWAAEHGMPAPSYAIFVGGALATVLGAGLLGHVLGGRGRA